MRLVLGSASPRRRELLAQIGFQADEIRPADIDESPAPGELPRLYCIRMAREKLAAIDVAPGEVVLCADTTVALGRRILGKPANADEAERFLRLMSGRRHQVITAVAVKTDTALWQRDVVTKVRMKALAEGELQAYLASDEWRGKAGGYGIQGRAAAFIPWISGSFTAVVGLPLAETAGLLAAAGLGPATGSNAE